MDRLDRTRNGSRVSASAQGSETLRETFARCQDRLLGMLYCLLGNQDDAREAFQEAFVKCLRRLDGAPAVDDLEVWAFRIALNVGRDLRGSAWRRHRRRLADDESPVAAAPVPQAEAGSPDLIALVRRAVVDLPREEQEVFLLRQNGQMTYDQIAQVLNVPSSAVKARMQSALAQLRQRLLSTEAAAE